ncbi:solute carrier family 28 member 3-like [Copidosoma floridanum]|uniref:solute carrier family 28 member 3-like n=1 Tax=Copidosoma floridanum TaxID=29053 RepID=UPI0006C9D607|nr:solute carrier family 28 member 3-like [Copidosoma floridanum]
MENNFFQEGVKDKEEVEGTPSITDFQEKNISIDMDGEKEENVYQRFVSSHPVFFKYCRLAVVHIVAVAYFAAATYSWKTKKEDTGFNWCNGYGLLLLIYTSIYGRLLYVHIFEKHLCNALKKTCCARFNLVNYKNSGQMIEIGVCVTISLAIIIFLVIDTRESRDRLIGLIGIIAIMAIGWGISKYPTKVSWKPVVWGLIFQYVLAIIFTRWPIGRSIFQCLSEKIVVFLDFAKDGAKFVFSDKLVDNGIFAFTVMPVIVFFSFVVSILYHFGVMQYMIKKIGWLLSVTLGTTACESLHAATTLFLGLPETFLVIEPYLNELTNSEIHAIMCSCFSTISGTVLAAYISYGAQPMHLITAMVMSAPAGLSFAKLLYPETKKSSTQFNNIVLKKARQTTFLDAATDGALSAIPLVLGCIANVIAFVAAVAFLNAILAWFGTLLGYPALTFEIILAKIFTPISYVIGVPWEECETVGSLIGLKTVVNELVAFQRFGEIKKTIGFSPKAEAIATYAISGFSNPGSLGVCVGSLSAMANEKKDAISGTVIRAFVGGIAVCFLTASIAGMLVIEDPESKASTLHSYNSTSLIL